MLPRRKCGCELSGAAVICARQISAASSSRPSVRYASASSKCAAAITPRYFQPNLKTKRVWVAELKKFVTVKITARALKTMNKNGTYATLKKAGIVS